MARRPVLEFWYEFASSYSYLSAMRIEALAEGGGRRHPLAAVPARADLRGSGLDLLPLQPLPGQGPLHVARPRAPGGGARASLQEARPLSAEWAHRRPGRALRRRSSLGRRPSPRRSTGPSSAKAAPSPTPAPCRRSWPISASTPTTSSKGAQGDANKTRLKALSEEARSRGIFGAPTFFTEDGEMFWGNDRLEQALAWAAGERPGRG